MRKNLPDIVDSDGINAYIIRTCSRIKGCSEYDHVSAVSYGLGFYKQDHLRPIWLSATYWMVSVIGLILGAGSLSLIAMNEAGVINYFDFVLALIYASMLSHIRYLYRINQALYKKK